LDFADDIPGVVEIICSKKLCLGLAVDPDDDPLALPTVDGAHTEAKARAVFSIVPDSAVLDPVWIELLVAARPPVQMVGPKAGDVEKLHRDLHASRSGSRGITPRHLFLAELWGDCNLSRFTRHLISCNSARSGRRSGRPFCLPLACLPRGGVEVRQPAGLRGV